MTSDARLEMSSRCNRSNPDDAFFVVDGHQGEVVVLRAAGGEILRGAEDGKEGRICRRPLSAQSRREQPIGAEFFIVFVSAFDDSVRVRDQRVAGLKHDAAVRKRRVGNRTEERSAVLEELHGVVLADQEGGWLSGIAKNELAGERVEPSQEQGDGGRRRVNLEEVGIDGRGGSRRIASRSHVHAH